MLVKELAERIASYAKEIACDGNGRIASHKVHSSVQVQCSDRDDDAEYELVDIDIERLPGCGCWAGIVFVIRKRSDAALATSPKEQP